MASQYPVVVQCGLWGPVRLTMVERHAFASVSFEQTFSFVSVGCPHLAGDPSPPIGKPLPDSLLARGCLRLSRCVGVFFVLLVMGQVLSLLVMLRRDCNCDGLQGETTKWLVLDVRSNHLLSRVI